MSHFKIPRKRQVNVNLIFQCLKCFILRNSNLILKCKRTPYVQNFLFNL